MNPASSVTFASLTILTKGILNTLLGILHLVGTFTFERSAIAGQGSAQFQRDYLIWFTGVGVFILFMAAVDLLCYPSLKAKVNLAWRVTLLCSLFTTLLGLFGVTMFGISPPLELLITGAVGTIVLLLARREFHAR